MRRGKLHELVIQKMTIVREVVHHAVGVFVNNTERFELLLEADDLRRAHVLVVCGDAVDETVKNDIATAERLRITATTLDGILTVKGQGRGAGE